MNDKIALALRNSRTGIILLGVAMNIPFLKHRANQIALKLFYMGPA